MLWNRDDLGSTLTLWTILKKKRLSISLNYIDAQFISRFVQGTNQEDTGMMLTLLFVCISLQSHMVYIFIIKEAIKKTMILWHRVNFICHLRSCKWFQQYLFLSDFYNHTPEYCNYTPKQYKLENFQSNIDLV